MCLRERPDHHLHNHTRDTDTQSRHKPSCLPPSLFIYCLVCLLCGVYLLAAACMGSRPRWSVEGWGTWARTTTRGASPGAAAGGRLTNTTQQERDRRVRGHRAQVEIGCMVYGGGCTSGGASGPTAARRVGHIPLDMTHRHNTDTTKSGQAQANEALLGSSSGS